MNPNTNILAGKLKESDLEIFLKAYDEIGLDIISSVKHTSIESINKENLNLKEFELTPQPFGRADYKLIIGVKSYNDGNIYVHTEINADGKVEEYDHLIRQYFRNL